VTGPIGSKHWIGIPLTVVVVLASLPASVYLIFWNVAKVLSTPSDPAFPHLPALQNFLAICWFTVVLAGRPLCAVALLLDVVLVFWRRQSVWLRVVGSIFAILALLGTALVEFQARHGRQ
jgi:hypothetical protein